jgi:hypothetical protein
MKWSLSGRRLRRIQRIARVANIVVVSAAILLTAALMWPQPAWTRPVVDLKPAANEPLAAPQPPLDLSVVWQRNLRQPLFDAPPAAAASKPEAPLSIQLLGTAIEDERRFAVLTLASNVPIVREIGAVVDGYELTAIERGLVRLKRGDKSYELRVPWYARLVAAEAAHPESSP